MPNQICEIMETSIFLRNTRDIKYNKQLRSIQYEVLNYSIKELREKQKRIELENLIYLDYIESTYKIYDLNYSFPNNPLNQNAFRNIYHLPLHNSDPIIYTVQDLKSLTQKTDAFEIAIKILTELNYYFSILEKKVDKEINRIKCLIFKQKIKLFNFDYIHILKNELSSIRRRHDSYSTGDEDGLLINLETRFIPQIIQLQLYIYENKFKNFRNYRIFKRDFEQ